MSGFSPEDGWRRAYAPAVDEGARALLQEFQEGGFVWLANRVLHPFGWALGVTVEVEGGRVTGLGVQRTADPEGIVTSLEDEMPARRRFLAAIARPVAEPVPEVAGLLPTACPACGRARYAKLPGGGYLPSERGPLTAVEPHPLAMGAVALGCGNPRCEAYEPPPRLPEGR